MNKQLFKQFTARDLFFIVVGILILGLGSALSYEAQIGVGSMATMVDGIHVLLGISRGLADILVSACMLIVAFILARDLIGIGTLISLFGIGLSIDFWKWAISGLSFSGEWE